MPLATLSIDLEARLAKLEEGFDKAGRLSEKAANQIESAFNKNRKAAEDLGKAIGAAFSVGVLVNFVHNTISGVDALNDLKDATGASIENISALEDVAARTGTSFEAMSGTLVKFNKVLIEAKPGSEVANTLKALGLNAEELKRIDPAEALRQTAVALAGFADDGNKARIVSTLFGKSVQEVAPFLKDLADQGKLVAKVTTEQAQAAEDFGHALDNLQKNSKDAARTLLSDFVPALAAVLKTYNDQGLLKALDDFGERAFGWTSNQQRKQIKVVEAEIKDLREEFDRWEGVPAQQKAVSAAIDANVKKLADLNRAYLKITDASAGAGRGSLVPEMPRNSVGDIPGADTAAKISEFQKYIDKLKDGQAALLNVTEEERARYETTYGKFAQYPDAQKAYLIEVAKTNDAIKAMTKSEKEYVEATELDTLIAQQTELNALLDKTPTAVLEKQRHLQTLIAQAYERGEFGLVGSKQALDAYTEAVQTALPELEKLKDDSNEFAKQAASNIQDSLGETLKRTMKGDFDSIADLWRNMLLDMAAQAAAAKLNKALFGDDFGSTGNIGGLLGAIFKGGGGASTGAELSTNAGLPIGTFAAGGDPPVGKWSLVGENGPELFRPKSAGTIVPNHKLGGASFDFSGLTVNVGQGVSRGEVQAAVQVATMQTEERIRRSLRLNGYA